MSPDTVVMAASITAAAASIAAAITSLKQGKVQKQIHVLVNSNMKKALSEIASLKAKLEKEEKDHQ